MKKVSTIKSPFGYIEVTPNYLKEMAEDFPSVFTPDLWWRIEPGDEPNTDEEWDNELGKDFDWEYWPEETAIPLTFEGKQFIDEYIDDCSWGYDLCNGRAKGYANQYSNRDVWEMVKDPKNGYRMTEPISDEDFARLSAVATTDYKKYVSLLKNQDEIDFYWWASSLQDDGEDFDDAMAHERFADFVAKLGELKCRQIWHDNEMYETIVNS